MLRVGFTGLIVVSHMSSAKMPFRRYWVFSLLILVSVSGIWPALAEETQTMTMPEAIDMAIENNPQLQAERATLGLWEAQIITAGTRLNPQLYSDNGMAEYTYRLGIEQVMELGGKRHKRVELSKAQRDAALSDLNTKVLALRTAVRKAYTQLYIAQEKQQAYQAVSDITKNLLDISEKRQKNGDVSALDVLQAETEYLSARNDFETNEYQTISSRSTLNTLLNKPLPQASRLAAPTVLADTLLSMQPDIVSQESISLRGTLNTPDNNLDILNQKALENRPEVLLNQQHQGVALSQLNLAKANRIPNLTLSMGPDYVAQGSNTPVAMFATGMLEIPVFNRQQGKIQEALAQHRVYEREKEALLNQIRLEVANAYTAYVLNQKRLERYKVELLPRADEIVKKSRRSFEMGKSSILVPINAQQAYMRIRFGYLQTLLDYQNAISDLERAIGAGL